MSSSFLRVQSTAAAVAKTAATAARLAATKQTVRAVATTTARAGGRLFTGTGAASLTAPGARRAVAPSTTLLARRFSSGGDVVEVVPPLGDSITSAVIKTWMVHPGDTVNMDDVVVVVETDKVTVDIRAKRSGTFVSAMGEEGAEIGIGEALYTIKEGAGSPAASKPADGEAKSAGDAPAASAGGGAPGPVETTTFPAIAESVKSGTVAKWHFQVGDAVAVDDAVVSVATDKTTADVRAQKAGKLTKMYVKEDAEVLVGEALFDLEIGAAGNTAAAAAPAAAAPAASAPKAAAPKPAAAPAAPSAPAAVPVAEGDRSETRVKMTRMRQRISQRLKESQNTAAMLTTFQEVDMGAIMDLRNRYKEQFEKTHKVKLGFMSAFVKASTAALQEVKAVNAVIDDATNEIIYRNYVDVSVAVASPTGLVVPVLRNCEKMSFADVEKSIAMYGAKAKDGSLAIEDMVGGTFTISNGGTFGSLYGTPIINPPQSAILGMHATKMRAMVNAQGTVVARPMMYLALTYDHRLIDGREAVTFLKSVANKVEDPSRMLLEL